MEIPSTIADLVHFVGGEVSFVDTYDGITSYHCEQREGVRESELPFDFQVRMAGENATLLFAGRSGKTVEVGIRWVDDMYSDECKTNKNLLKNRILMQCLRSKLKFPFFQE